MTETQALPLPRTFAEFTPEWFTQALANDFPGAQVSALVSSGERVGTSASARFELEYSAHGPGPTPPPSVYVKGGFTPAQLQRYWTVLQHEAIFYNTFAADVPMHIPRHFFAAVDDHQQGIVVLEDMALRGVRFGSWGGLTVDEVAALLEQLARMHSRWWLDSQVRTITAGWEAPQREFCAYLLRDKYWTELLDRDYATELVEAVPNPEIAREALRRMWALNDAAPHTLLHADTHGGNTFFEVDGSAGLTDFQLSFAGTPLYDMSWLITAGLSIDDRRAHESELIKSYLQAGRAGGMDLPDFDGAWLVHRQQAINAFMNGACQPLASGPIEMVNAASYVVCAAATDLDPISALGLQRG